MKLDWKKPLIALCGVLLSVSMFFIMLFNSVEGVAFDTDRYQEAYEKYDRPTYIGISMEQLMDVTDNMLDYLKGKRADLVMQADIGGVTRNVFDDREIAHMKDVQKLFLQGFMWRRILFGVLALSLLGMGLLGAGRSVRAWPKCWYIVVGVLGAAGLAVGIWCLTDFTAAFTAFHELLFTNDLWLLDPNYEVLIQMFPEEFFDSVASAILLRFGGQVLLMTGLAVGASIWKKKNAKEEPSRELSA
ncbi:MAG: TIGR01906 family membrane protein [Eubacteriales bacterium]|nr:TIGR01906 family membrane protein [Eubacteriales bacterium]